jgi:hypothetical protein
MSDQVAALWTRINELNCELDALYADAATNILRRDAGRRNAECEGRAAVLRHDLAEARAALPAEGMRSGQRLVMYRGVGEVVLRDDPEPEFAEAETPLDIWDWE